MKSVLLTCILMIGMIVTCIGLPEPIVLPDRTECSIDVAQEVQVYAVADLQDHVVIQTNSTINLYANLESPDTKTMEKYEVPESGPPLITVPLEMPVKRFVADPDLVNFNPKQNYRSPSLPVDYY